MKRIIVILVVAAAAAGLGVYFYSEYQHEQAMLNPDFYSGNGRLEAKEVYVSAKLAGKIEKVFVKEGSLVKKGDKLVQMQVSTLEAQKASTEAKVKVQEGELAMAKATVMQKQSVLDGAEKEYIRQGKLRKTNANSVKNFEDAQTDYNKAKAELEYAKASVLSAEGKIAEQKAELNRIDVDIKDSLLTAAYDGRIQYELAHEGEVVSAGGRVLNLVNLTDAFVTFFLPTNIAGKITVGAEAKIVFDAEPDDPVDAKITFIDPVAQFTPKSVETKVEREKLMFRIKASVNPELLSKYISLIKTGLPGVVWVKVNPGADWKTCSAFSGSTK